MSPGARWRLMRRTAWLRIPRSAQLVSVEAVTAWAVLRMAGRGEVAVDGSHCDGSFADRTGNSFGRAVANVAGGEHARRLLEWIGLTLQRPVGTGYITGGQHEAVLVEAEGGGQPVGVGWGADHDEYRRGGHLFLLILVVLQGQTLQAVSPPPLTTWVWRRTATFGVA